MAGDVVLAQRGARVGVCFGDAGAHGGEAFGAELFLGQPGARSASRMTSLAEVSRHSSPPARMSRAMLAWRVMRRHSTTAMEMPWGARGMEDD